jgi:hypothetical protein
MTIPDRMNGFRKHILMTLTGAGALMLLLPVIFGVTACRPDPGPKATPYALPVPKFFPTRMNIPSDNPLTLEGIELGRYLF